MCNEQQICSDFIGVDLAGYYYNCKYPPNKERFGEDFEGYETPNQLTFFYDFCIQQYGVYFNYGESRYEVKFSDDGSGPVLLNLTTGEMQGPFGDAVLLLKESHLGKFCLIDIIDEVENVTLR